MENLIIPAYVVYAIFVTALTFFVAKILFKNSETFMMIIFNDRENLALATNRLFRVGFFLFAFGIGMWYLSISYDVIGFKTLFEILSVKVGSFTIFIGILFFANLYMFFRGMKVAKRNRTLNEQTAPKS